MGEPELLPFGGPGRLWLVAPPQPAGGELAGPPPESDAAPLHQWQERVAALDAHPGEWIRWEYSDGSGASKAFNRYVAKTDPELYDFAHRRVDGVWWLYGRRNASTLFDTPDDPMETTTCSTEPWT